jgi:hypothetical protein
VAGDVLQDTVVGSRRSSPIVLRLQAVYRNGQMEVPQISPGGGNWADGARDHLYLHIHVRQFRKQEVEFAITHQRLTAYDREVQGAEAAHQSQDALHQRLASMVTELDEGARSSQVLGLVRVTARAF